MLGDVQLARRLAEPRDHQQCRHLRPRNRLSALRHELRAQFIESQRSPQRPSQPHAAERARPFQADLIESNGYALRLGRGFLEQFSLITTAPGDLLRQQPRPRTPLAVELSELRDGLLHDLAPAAHRTNQTPVRMRLAVLPPHRVPQVQPPPLLAPSTIAALSANPQGARSALHAHLAQSQRKVPPTTETGESRKKSRRRATVEVGLERRRICDEGIQRTSEMAPARGAALRRRRGPSSGRGAVAAPAWGKKLFVRHCSACHGSDGRGAGPAAAALKTAPPDLTQLRRTHEGKFPFLRVVEFIDGERPVPAHGSREMPIWGHVFRWKEGDTGRGLRSMRSLSTSNRFNKSRPLLRRRGRGHDQPLRRRTTSAAHASRNLQLGAANENRCERDARGFGREPPHCRPRRRAFLASSSGAPVNPSEPTLPNESTLARSLVTAM